MSRKTMGITAALVTISCLVSTLAATWFTSMRVADAQPALPGGAGVVAADIVRARLVQSVELSSEDITLVGRRIISGFPSQTPARARLFVGPDGQPAFQLLDEAQRPRAALAYLDGQPALSILDDSQRPRLSASATSLGNGSLVVRDAGGREVVTIREQSNGAAIVQLSNPGSSAQITFGFTDESDPALRRPVFRMLDAQGTVVFQAPAATP